MPESSMTSIVVVSLIEVLRCGCYIDGVLHLPETLLKLQPNNLVKIGGIEFYLVPTLLFGGRVPYAKHGGPGAGPTQVGWLEKEFLDDEDDHGIGIFWWWW
uniref:Uncharacterized protein n=1 Tax=Cannabis sativa TaxID=3483 RepID=A0A803PG31_CANSA